MQARERDAVWKGVSVLVSEGWQLWSATAKQISGWLGLTERFRKEEGASIEGDNNVRGSLYRYLSGYQGGG